MWFEMDYPIRLKLFNTYKDKWSEAWIELDEEGEEAFYKNAKNVLQDFINECKTIIKTNDLEITCELSDRQNGGYKRCITDYPDKGWNTEREQIGQAYKELIVDFLYYSDSKTEYKELTIKEIVTMVEMAEFLIGKIDKLLEIIESNNLRALGWDFLNWLRKKASEDTAKKEDEDPFLIKTLKLQGRTNWHKLQKEKKNSENRGNNNW